MSTSQNIAQWSVTAADNDDADTGVNWAEGQVPGTVNNSARAMMAALAKWRLDVGGALAAGGSANALTVTTNGLLEAAQIAAGLMLVVRATADNTNATVTFNPDSRGALNIKRADGSALAVGSIKSGMYLILFYNAASTEWRAANIGPDISAISGNLAVGGTLGVTGATTLSSTLAVTGATTLSSTLAVTGASTFTGAVAMNGGGTLGDATGDAVVIKGVTVTAAIANTWDAATLAAQADEILDSLGTTKGNIVWHNGTSWVVLAPP